MPPSGIPAPIEKALLLLSLLPRRPLEVYDRIRHFAAGRGRHDERPGEAQAAVALAELLSELGGLLGVDLEAPLADDRVTRFEREIAERRADLAGRPFHPSHTGDPELGRLCYAVCRALKPETVVETGVAYGLTSAYILRALDDNAAGTLTSIDLPPLAWGADRHVGALIPPRLRRRWTLLRGTSGRLLEPAFERLRGADLFVHDSLHTRENMLAEFELAAAHLRPPGVLVSDDVDHNPAWAEWTVRRRPAFHRVVQESEKANQIGVAVLGSSPSTSR